MNPAASAPPSPRRGIAALRSSAGAFDLPSILVGVVVVGILTAGVMAAIFGVIPWAQDRSAKQDLAAINTAQGVTYAKDGQAYKDLAGLEGAGLVSGLADGTADVTTSSEGKGFRAEVAAGNGNKWFITHDDPTPRGAETAPSDPAPGGHNWASAKCTPWVVEELEIVFEGYADPAVAEYSKLLNGQPYEVAVIAAWMARIAGTGAEPEDAPSGAEWEIYLAIGTTWFEMIGAWDTDHPERMSAHAESACHS